MDGVKDKRGKEEKNNGMCVFMPCLALQGDTIN